MGLLRGVHQTSLWRKYIPQECISGAHSAREKPPMQRAVGREAPAVPPLAAYGGSEGILPPSRNRRRKGREGGRQAAEQEQARSSCPRTRVPAGRPHRGREGEARGPCVAEPGKRGGAGEERGGSYRLVPPARGEAGSERKAGAQPGNRRGEGCSSQRRKGWRKGREEEEPPRASPAWPRAGRKEGRGARGLQRMEAARPCKDTRALKGSPTPALGRVPLAEPRPCPPLYLGVNCWLFAMGLTSE